MELTLGLDIGTTGARAIAVDAASGRIIAEAAARYSPSTPRPGWVEQDPHDWWEAARTVLSEIAATAEGTVRGLGLTGQMHGSVFLDSAGEVIRPALLWNDQRTGAEAEAITAALGDRLMAIAGNPALTGFQAPKILWLRENEPDAYARVRAVLLPKDYVRFRLTGERATDVSDASGTLLLEVGMRRWSTEILDELDIPPDWLPTLHEGPDQAGSLRADVAADLGLPAGLPVAAGGGDNAAAAIGAGVTSPGSLLVSLGTSGVLFAPTEGFRPDPSGRVHAFAHALPGVFHLMAVTLSAGGSLRWWSEVTGASFAELVSEAQTVAAGAERALFLPYLTGERTPHLDPHARGAFVGLTVRHGRGELTRAVLEGVAFSLRDGLDVMRELGVEESPVRAVGGGARSELWCQIIADVLDRPIFRAPVDEGPAYGAALLARVTAGLAPDATSNISATATAVAEPEPERVELYDRIHEDYARLYGILHPRST